MYSIASRFARYLAYGSAISMFARARRPDEVRSLWTTTVMEIRVDTCRLNINVGDRDDSIIPYFLNWCMRVTRFACDTMSPMQWRNCSDSDHRVKLSTCFPSEMRHYNSFKNFSCFSDTLLVLIYRSRISSWTEFVKKSLKIKYMTIYDIDRFVNTQLIGKKSYFIFVLAKF